MSSLPSKTLYELAHSLREPLTTIMLWEQIMRATDDPEVKAQALDAIRTCAQAQAALIDQIVRSRP